MSFEQTITQMSIEDAIQAAATAVEEEKLTAPALENLKVSVSKAPEKLDFAALLATGVG